MNKTPITTRPHRRTDKILNHPADTRENYLAASIILKTISFARPFISNSNESVDWAGIAEQMDKILPSENEKTLVNLAHQMWLGADGFVGEFLDLDKDNRNAVVCALAMLVER